MRRLAILSLLLFSSPAAFALPGSRDRVYTADQNSNTVSVIDPASNTLLGQIRLGNPRPDILSPLYRGEVNVHGLGFSPDHKMLVAVSTVTNSVTFIDTATSKVKGRRDRDSTNAHALSGMFHPHTSCGRPCRAGAGAEPRPGPG